MAMNIKTAIDELRDMNAQFVHEPTPISEIIEALESAFDQQRISDAIGGQYRMPDGRVFWIDSPVANEIADRILKSLTPQYNHEI